MEDIVTCPSCLQKLRMTENARGRPMRCPRCQQVFHPGNLEIQASPSPPGPPLDRGAVQTPAEDPSQREPSSPWPTNQGPAAREWDIRASAEVQPKGTRALCIATTALLGLN